MHSIKSRLSVRHVLIIIFVIELIIFLREILENNISAGHDTIQYFILQYYFLNHLVCHGEIPQWMPYMTQGTVATWWFSIQADLFQNALMVFHPLIKNVNFTTLFTVGIFWKHLLLLCGVWLWGRVHLKNPWSLLFFCSSVMGSVIWMNQIWYNFHFYYALPLVFFLFHKFLQTAQCRWLFLAGQLWLLQSFGNMPYFLPMTAWILFSYFALFLIQQRHILPDCVKRLKYLNLALVLLIHAATAWFYIFLTTQGTEQILNYNPGRNLDGTTSLNDFLTYGGKLELYSWAEAFFGISPMMDYTLYCGTLTMTIALCGILLGRSLKAFTWILIWGILLFLLNLTLWPTTWLYEWWPMMKYYRHLSLLAPITKLTLCLWAAIVLDHLLENRSTDRQLKIFAGLCFGIIGGIFLTFLQNDGYQKILLLTISPSMFFREVQVFLDWSRQTADQWAAIRIGVLTLTLAGLSMLILRPTKKVYILIFLVVIHLVDVYSYKIHETLKRTVKNTAITTTRFEHIPFATRRSTDEWEEHSRSSFLKQLPLHYVKNWATNSFIYFDEPGSSFRVDHWLKPYDQYLRTYSRQSLNNRSERPAGLVDFQRLDFPMEHPAALKFSAVTEGKLQFFTNAFAIPETTLIAKIMSDPHYPGDTPLLLKRSALPEEKFDITTNSRIDLPYRIINFSSNRLTVKIDNPNGLAKWLVYSDIWHPDWKVFNNGQKTALEQANLAYKAVKLSPGEQVIEFRFFSQQVNFLAWVLAWISLFWVFGIILLTIRIFFSNSKKDGHLI